MSPKLESLETVGVYKGLVASCQVKLVTLWGQTCFSSTRRNSRHDPCARSHGGPCCPSLAPSRPFSSCLLAPGCGCFAATCELGGVPCAGEPGSRTGSRKGQRALETPALPGGWCGRTLPAGGTHYGGHLIHFFNVLKIVVKDVTEFNILTTFEVHSSVETLFPLGRHHPHGRSPGVSISERELCPRLSSAPPSHLVSSALLLAF